MTSKNSLRVFTYAKSRACRLEQFSENSYPISAEDFFNLLIAETTLYQFSSEIQCVRMVPQIGNEVRRCKFCSQLLLPRLRPLLIDEFEEIKADTDAVDSDQIHHVLDMINIMTERAFFFFWAHEDTIGADNAVPFTNHFDLFITNVALDLVVAAGVS